VFVQAAEGLSRTTRTGVTEGRGLLSANRATRREVRKKKEKRTTEVVGRKVVQRMLEQRLTRLLRVHNVAHEIDRVLVLGNVPQTVARNDHELVAFVEGRLSRVGRADDELFDACVTKRTSDSEDT
jgi:hypothetical protein